MQRYILYCTESQTRKAIELGAPILQHPFHESVIKGNEKLFENITNINGKYYCLPTAEQMLGWLEEQRLAIDVVSDNGGFEWSVWIKKEHCSNYSFIEENDRYFPSRQEATLAAIDAALEYLTNNKK